MPDPGGLLTPDAVRAVRDWAAARTEFTATSAAIDDGDHTVGARHLTADRAAWRAWALVLQVVPGGPELSRLLDAWYDEHDRVYRGWADLSDALTRRRPLLEAYQRLLLTCDQIERALPDIDAGVDLDTAYLMAGLSTGSRWTGTRIP